MIRKALLLKLLLLPVIVFSQQVEITLTIIQGLFSKAVLYEYVGIQTFPIDTSYISANGSFQFLLKEGHRKGLYKIEVGKGTAFDIVVSNEVKIDISTFVFAFDDSLKSKTSLENQVFWRYVQQKKRIDQQSWLLRTLLDFYPDSTIFKSLINNELLLVNSTLLSYANKLNREHPELLASKLILVDSYPVFDENQSIILPEVAFNNWWGSIDLMDSRLLNSPFISRRLWRYIESLFISEYDREEQEALLIQGIAKLLDAGMNPIFTAYLRNTLYDGFSDSEYNHVVEFLETGTYNGLEPIVAKIEKPKQKALSTRVGNIAYDFNIQNNEGETIKLSELNSKFKILVFWSTWCPHCIETLPSIVEVYNNYQKDVVEVIAISIDSEEQLWQQYVDNLNLRWINLREPFSEHSALLTSYDVQETPKMFILANDLTILSRPTTPRQLEVKLRRLIRSVR